MVVEGGPTDQHLSSGIDDRLPHRIATRGRRDTHDTRRFTGPRARVPRTHKAYEVPEVRRRRGGTTGCVAWSVPRYFWLGGIADRQSHKMNDFVGWLVRTIYNISQREIATRQYTHNALCTGACQNGMGRCVACVRRVERMGYCWVKTRFFWRLFSRGQTTVTTSISTPLKKCIALD